MGETSSNLTPSFDVFLQELFIETVEGGTTQSCASLAVSIGLSIAQFRIILHNLEGCYIQCKW